jgi:hypothetical protein
VRLAANVNQFIRNESTNSDGRLQTQRLVLIICSDARENLESHTRHLYAIVCALFSKMSHFVLMLALLLILYCAHT